MTPEIYRRLAERLAPMKERLISWAVIGLGIFYFSNFIVAPITQILISSLGGVLWLGAWGGSIAVGAFGPERRRTKNSVVAWSVSIAMAVWFLLTISVIVVAGFRIYAALPVT